MTILLVSLFFNFFMAISDYTRDKSGKNRNHCRPCQERERKKKVRNLQTLEDGKISYSKR